MSIRRKELLHAAATGSVPAFGAGPRLVRAANKTVSIGFLAPLTGEVVT